MAAKQNLEVEQGAYWAQQLVWQQGDPPAAVDLSAYTARMQVRVRLASPIAVSLKSPGATGSDGPTGSAVGTITLEGAGATGSIDLEIAATETAKIAPGKFVYDLELVPADGRVRRLLQGNFTVTPEVTR